MKLKILMITILLLTILVVSTSCENYISPEASTSDAGKDNGYISVSIGDNIYSWLTYGGYFPKENILVLIVYNANHLFVPIADNKAKIADPASGYVIFRDIQIEPDGDMKAYISHTK